MVVLLFGAALAGELTLAEALGLAVQQNLELSGARRGHAIARWRLVDAQGAFDPSLNASVRTGGARSPTNNVVDGKQFVNTASRSWNAGISQDLPTGGSLSASWSEFTSLTDSENAFSDRFVSTGADVSLSQPLLRGAGPIAALAGVQDARLDLVDQELAWRQQLERLALDVSDAYWGLVSARESLSLAERALELAQDQLTRTTERQTAGFAGTGEVLQVQVSVGAARQQQVASEADLEAAQDRLARLLGLPLAEGVSLDPTDRPALTGSLPERDALLEVARQRNADLMRAAVDRERSERQLRRARNAALPSLGLDASAGLSAGAISAAEARQEVFGALAPSWSVGLNVQLPVLMRAVRAGLGVARLQDEGAALRWQAAEQDVELAVDASVRAIRRDLASLDVAGDTLDFARRSLDAQRELLSEGRGSTRDVVDALESLRRAEVDKLGAEIALQRSLLEADQVAGTLLDTLVISAVP